MTQPELTDGVRMRLTLLFLLWQCPADIIRFLKHPKRYPTALAVVLAVRHVTETTEPKRI